MEVVKQDYVSIISQFYKKVIKYHSKRRNLLQKFNEFIKNCDKQTSELRTTDRGGYLAKSTKSARNINQSHRSIGSISPTKSSKGGKSQRIFKSESILFSSSSFLRTFMFAYIHFLINNDKVNQFQQLSEKTAEYLQQSKAFDQNALKRVNYLWMKIGQFLSKRSKVRWTFQMKESFNQFTDDFIKGLLIAVMKKKIDFNKITDDNTSGQQFMKQLVKSAPVNIAYFEIIQDEIENLVRYGNYKQQLSIGYDVQQKKYLFFEQVPSRKAGNFKVDNVNKKIAATVESLLKDYKENTEKLLNLDFLKDSESKEAKIKKYLSIQR